MLRNFLKALYTFILKLYNMYAKRRNQIKDRKGRERNISRREREIRIRNKRGYEERKRKERQKEVIRQRNCIREGEEIIYREIREEFEEKHKKAIQTKGLPVIVEKYENEEKADISIDWTSKYKYGNRHYLCNKYCLVLNEEILQRERKDRLRTIRLGYNMSREYFNGTGIDIGERGEEDFSVYRERYYAEVNKEIQKRIEREYHGLLGLGLWRGKGKSDEEIEEAFEKSRKAFGSLYAPITAKNERRIERSYRFWLWKTSIMNVSPRQLKPGRKTQKRQKKEKAIRSVNVKTPAYLKKVRDRYTLLSVVQQKLNRISQRYNIRYGFGIEEIAENIIDSINQKYYTAKTPEEKNAYKDSIWREINQITEDLEHLRTSVNL